MLFVNYTSSTLLQTLNNFFNSVWGPYMMTSELNGNVYSGLPHIPKYYLQICYLLLKSSYGLI